MNRERISKSSCRELFISLLMLVVLGGGTVVHAVILEGQNKGDTNTWSAGNLQDWQELDFIPCRIHWSGEQGNNLAVRIDFPHRSTGIPGFQDLFNFSNSANVFFVSPPVLSAPANSSTWSYSFTVNILNNLEAYVYFQARLAAGAHLNVGSSLKIGGDPSSMGNLQIHKPAPGPGTPDLMVIKTGPSTGKPGDFITYTLSYTNKTTGFNPATGVQLNDVLPPEILVDTNNLAGGVLSGNTIFWDLPNLPLGAGGRISFPAQISPVTGNGVDIANTAQILSAENDLNYSDNTSILITTTASCSPPVVTNAPTSRTNCVGTTATFSVSATGTSLTYQWYKESALLPGQNGNNLVLNNVLEASAGVYAVVVSGACGNPITKTSRHAKAIASSIRMRVR